LRQLDPEIAAEQARPGAAGQHHRAAGDSAPFGNHTYHAACRSLDAAHRATGKDGRSETTRRPGDRRPRHLGLGLAIGRRKERTGIFLRDAWQASRDFSAANDSAIQLILARMVEPVFEPCEIRPRFSQIHDAGSTEAGLGLDHLVHALPYPQTLDGQRQFARIARHLPAPAPIAARLLVGNVSLLAQCDRNALPCQEQRRTGADDPTANNDDINAGRQGLIGGD
jgi:hypothetical protein